MTKLKTLKDLIDYTENYAFGNINPEELKAEAVKWVKSLKLMEEIDKNKNDFITAAFSGGGETVFKRFFNITEEDLK